MEIGVLHSLGLVWSGRLRSQDFPHLAALLFPLLTVRQLLFVDLH